MNTIKLQLKLWIEEYLYFFNKRSKSAPFCPVFIIGCGRSGTTILGDTLAFHPEIFYLKETHSIHLYNRFLSELDLYFNHSKPAFKKLILDYNESNSRRSIALRRAFKIKFVNQDKKVFLEKMHLNIFRLNWLHKTFPNARFIYIKRNGLEVAASIEKIGPLWFGKESIIWDLLVKYAMQFDSYKDILPRITTNFEKGLVQWKIANNLADTFFKSLSKNKFHRIQYSDFIENPISEVQAILDFLCLNQNNAVDTFITKNISRRSKKLNLEDFQNHELLSKIYNIED